MAVRDSESKQTMIKRMLVPVKENRLREIVPRLAKIVEPQCHLVFLLPYVDEKHRLSIFSVFHTGRFSDLNNFSVGDNELSYAWNTSRDIAKKFIRTKERPGDLGAQVTVDLFLGSLKSALKRYVTDSQVQLVMLPCGPLRRWINSSSRNVPTLSFFQGDPLLPLLFLEPKDLNDRSLSIFLSRESNWC